MINEKRTVIIPEVELHWAKLVKPVEPFGTLQWELQMRTRDKAKAKAWKDEYYLPVKTESDDDGTYYKANVKRKALNKEGERNKAPEVVDANKQVIDGNNIGNGSMGNVMLFQYPYEVAGRKGVASMISKVQITDLKVYENSGATDFDVIGSDENAPEETVTDF